MDRVLDTAPTGGRVDRANQPGPAGGSLPTLIELTGIPIVSVPSRTSPPQPKGVRITTEIRYDQMNEVARLAGE
ncbi:hypothetical protein [Streptomyces canus]|uniref:hypothetical protein n=1 Tax=Streptomyces canus TaxID=58343 RepID=UPI0003799DA3|nr:hypothetical protein [Streptomyces canus]